VVGKKSKQTRYLEAAMRSISEDTETYEAGGLSDTLFNLTDGEIWVNKDDQYIKQRLNGAHQTVIRLTKPSHTSQGVTGSRYNHIEESQLMIQIDAISRYSEEYCDDLVRILEAKFLSAIEHVVDGVSIYLDVDRLEVRDSYEDTDLEASHSVLTLYGHFRGSVSS
jgi:5-bromo-4-chloroindolyl phosphate hydrolysis protein